MVFPRLLLGVVGQLTNRFWTFKLLGREDELVFVPLGADRLG